MGGAAAPRYPLPWPGGLPLNAPAEVIVERATQWLQRGIGYDTDTVRSLTAYLYLMLLCMLLIYWKTVLAAMLIANAETGSDERVSTESNVRQSITSAEILSSPPAAFAASIRATHVASGLS